MGKCAWYALGWRRPLFMLTLEVDRAPPQWAVVDQRGVLGAVYARDAGAFSSD